jgi:hypothetical protein
MVKLEALGDPMSVTNRRSAANRIEINCISPMQSAEGQPWWDIAIAPNDIEADLVAESVAYLESRGLLVRHTHARNWIKVLNAAATKQDSQQED